MVFKHVLNVNYVFKSHWSKWELSICLKLSISLNTFLNWGQNRAKLCPSGAHQTAPIDFGELIWTWFQIIQITQAIFSARGRAVYRSWGSGLIMLSCSAENVKEIVENPTKPEVQSLPCPHRKYPVYFIIYLMILSFLFHDKRNHKLYVPM